MKKLVTSLVVIIFSLFVLPTNAQSNRKPNRQSTNQKEKTFTYLNDNGALDSIVTYTYTDKTCTDSIANNKTTFEYDSNDNIVLLINYKADNSKNIWVGISKEISIYNGGNKTLEELYKWDNSKNTWIGSYKIIESFDSNNNKILYEYYSWDEWANNWKGRSKRVYSYDSNNNKTLEIYYSKWDATASEWIGSTKDIFEYDSFSNILSEVHYKWNRYDKVWYGNIKSDYTIKDNKVILKMTLKWYDDSGTWINYSKDSIFYGTQNNQILKKSYSWNKISNDWKKSIRIENTFDENNNIISEIVQKEDSENSNWINDSKRKFAYNTNDDIVSLYSFTWNKSSNKWDYTTRYLANYDASNNVLLEESSEWDANFNRWTVRQKYVFEYDNNNNNTLYEYYSWNGYDEKLEGSSKYNSEYDAHNNIILETNFLWDKNSNKWTVKDKTVFAYNSFNNEILEEHYEAEIGGAWFGISKQEFIMNANNNISFIIISSWNLDSNSWYKSGIHFYYYHNNELSNEFYEINKIIIYPNPVNSSEQLTIRTRSNKGFKYSIINTSGIIVLKGEITTNNIIDLSSISEGIYILEIEIDNKYQKIRFVKM